MDGATADGGPLDATVTDGATLDSAASEPAATDGGGADAPAIDAGPDAAPIEAGAPPGWPPPGCDAVHRFVANDGGQGPATVDVGDSQRYFGFDAPWGSTPAQAIAFRVVKDNRAVAKRWLLNTSTDRTNYSVGDEELRILPADVGLPLPPERRVELLVRYVNETGAAQLDASGVELCVVHPPHLRATSAASARTLVAGLLVPKGASNYENTASCMVRNVQPVTLLSASPYVHHFAVWTKFTVTKKNGTEIVLLHRAHELGGPTYFPLQPGIVVEQGDRITTTCVFNNPTNENLIGGTPYLEEGWCLNNALYAPAGILNCPLPGG